MEVAGSVVSFREDVDFLEGDGAVVLVAGACELEFFGVGLRLGEDGGEPVGIVAESFFKVRECGGEGAVKFVLRGSLFGKLRIEDTSLPTLADVLADLYSLSGVDAEALAAPDSDGVPNLIEYAFGSSPVLPASIPEATRLEIGVNAVRFSVIVRNDSNLTVIPKCSGDLTTWSAAGIAELVITDVSQDGVPSGFTRRTWKIEGSMPKMYLRWRVEYGD